MLSQQPSREPATSLGEIAALFLRLGVTAFGGPAALIAIMEHECVVRRRWLSREDFLDLLGAANLIPGPNATETAILIGHRRAGWKGLLVAGACFIIPAVLITMAMAWLYVAFGSLPKAQGFLYGAKPVIIAVVFQALWRLAGVALKTPTLTVVAAVGLVAGLFGLNVLLILFGAGILIAAMGWAGERRAGVALGAAAPAAAASATPTGAALAASIPFSLVGLFLFFLKVGAVLYGSGYVLLAFLQADLVDRLHWLSQAQLLDAVAVGQVTPGPVFSTATFIGYILGGGKGAAVATIGIFLPAFVLVAISGPIVARLRRSRIAAAFLDGVNAGALALMVVVTLQLGRAALVDFTTVAMAIAAGVLLLRFQTNSAWLLIGGGLLGLAALAVTGG